jgi:protocatechuate 3,4-dioxygenase beta subunit
VYAEKPGHSPAVLDQVRASDDVRITLDAPRALLGRVRDARSRPVAGARVRWLGLMAGTRVDRETLSAADGTYRIENVPSRRAYTFPGIEHNWLVEVTAEGYAPLTVARGAAQEGGPGEVRFDPVLLEGAVIRGRVIEGDTGRGVPGVPVWVWTARGNDQPHWWPRGRTGHGSPFGQRVRAETMSGPDGEFVVTGVPVLNLHEPAPSQTARGALGPILGYVGALVPGRTPATADLPAATAGERLDVELRSWPAGTVRGRVVDALGRPLARAQVFFHSGERSFHAFPREVEEAPKEHAFTNDEGRYRLPLVPALETGPTVVRLYCLLPTHDWTGGIEVPVVAGGSAEAPDLVVAADPLALIRVTDAAGRPVWGAQASLLERDPDAVFRASRSDEEGRLWCFFRKPGPWTVVVRASGCAAASVPGVVPSLDAPPTLAVTLQPGHRIAGRVVHAGGPPAAGVALGVSRGERLVAWALSREDGSFDVADLPEGPYRVEAALVRRPERPTIQARLEGVPTDARDLIVTIPEREALPEGSALEGSVSSALTREPVLHFRASLAQGSRVLAARLEAPGRFRIDGVPPGRWTLRIEAEGFVPREEELAIGPSGAPGPLDLTLERGTRVRGTVRAPAGLSILVQELAFVDRASGREVPATLARSGAYEAAGLGPGRWVARLRLRPMARRTALALARRHELFVPSGAEVLTVDLDAMAGGQLAVHLPGKGSDTTARLEVRDARGAVVWEGCARVRPFTETLSLPPGAYRVRLEEGGGGPEERAATVDVDGDARVEFPAR